jgi:chemotaxis family two-component system response regulator Rcp1
MRIDTVKNRGRPAEILLVEDNYGDIVLAKKAFTIAKISNNITVASNGIEAMEILRREGRHEALPMMDLILLDLNLPKKDGKQVLAEIKEDENLKRIPVVILTSSRTELDVVKSYNLHANSYVVKPVNMEKFGEIVHSIEQFWFAVVVLPNE